MTFAICNEIFQNWKLEDAMACAAKAGYSSIEIAPFTLARSVTDISSAERSRLRDQAARIGIAVCGIHWVLMQTEGLHLTHPDPQVRLKTSRYFCSLVDFCADLGGHILVLGSPKQRNLLPGVATEQASTFASETLRDAVRQAEDRHVTLCIEPLSPHETNFINTAAQAIQFATSLASPAMKIILDVKALCAEPTPIPDIIRQSWPHFAHFHANDSNLKGPGFGNVDFVPIAAALKETGYNGCISVEVFKHDETPEQIATQSIQYMRRVFA